MFKNKKRVLIMTIAALTLVLAFGTTSFAAGVQDTLKAQFKALKILLNGQTVTMESQPIIVNGSTYLPLRAFANLFNKNVDWNASLQQVSITDKPDSQLTTLQAQITDKESQITILQAQLTAAQKKNSDMKDEDDDDDDNDIDDAISELENDLNDDYDSPGSDWGNGDIDFDKIDVSGNEDDIKIKIYLELDNAVEDGDYDDNDDLWSALDQDDILDYVDSICSDVWHVKELKNCDITGTFYDSDDSNHKLDSFTADNDEEASID